MGKQRSANRPNHPRTRRRVPRGQSARVVVVDRVSLRAVEARGGSALHGAAALEDARSRGAIARWRLESRAWRVRTRPSRNAVLFFFQISRSSIVDEALLQAHLVAALRRRHRPSAPSSARVRVSASGATLWDGELWRGGETTGGRPGENGGRRKKTRMGTGDLGEGEGEGRYSGRDGSWGRTSDEGSASVLRPFC